MFNHVFEKQLVLCHSLKRFDQVGLKWKAVTNPLRDIGKDLYATFFHYTRLLGHVLEVHGIVEEILFECEKERAKFDWTFTTGLKLRKNYPAGVEQEYA